MPHSLLFRGQSFPLVACDEDEGLSSARTPSLKVTPTEIVMSAVQVGEQNSRQITLSNEGGANLLIDSINFEIPPDGTPEEFTKEHPPTLITIPPQESIDLIVRYLPQNEGADRATLLISNNSNEVLIFL